MALTIRLRQGVNEQLKEVFGCTTDAAVAELVGIDASQWSRVTRGRSSPGPVLQAQLLNATQKHLKFEDLFEVVPEVERSAS